jgi:hypothetical protein
MIKVRGRKPKCESRAQEIRTKLLVWNQSPESSRPSLRALAAEIGISHQLLSFYLKRLEEWQFKDGCRTAKKLSRDIPARAKAENRTMTMRECVAAIITPKVLEQIESIRQDAKRGSLNPFQFKLLKLWADSFPEAKWVLQKYSHIKPKWKNVELTPEQQRMAASLPKDQARRYERWIQDCSRGKGYNLVLP